MGHTEGNQYSRNKKPKYSLTIITRITTTKDKDPQYHHSPGASNMIFIPPSFFVPDIKKLDKLFIKLIKSTCHIPKDSSFILA
jgi:hypothetical protein